MNRRRHWIFWINCVAEIFLLLALICHESHTADGFGAGPEGTSRVSKKSVVGGSVPNLELNFDEELDVYGKPGLPLHPTNFPSGFVQTHQASVNSNAIAQEATLLASTLDGTLVALSSKSGKIIWSLNDQPVVKSPYDRNEGKPVLPAFLPDPKDGSIYMIGASLKDPLKKLPFTIPELVAASPCKSSDGTLYTGKKVDTWFSIDRFTGRKKGTISFDGCVARNDEDENQKEGSCPNLSPTNFLIGRTEYNIMMFDSKRSGKRWNITFYDYSSNIGGAEAGPDYNLGHFTDSSTGSLITLDKQTGAVQWNVRIGSPIVALYLVQGDGIVNVPFTSVSKETLSNLLDKFNDPMASYDGNGKMAETKLYPTLYVGEHQHGLYAMPSLVDRQTLTITPRRSGPLLLEGPKNYEFPEEIDNLDVITEPNTGKKGDSSDILNIPLNQREQQGGKLHQPTNHPKSMLLFGYYQVPDSSKIKLLPAVTQLQLTSASQASDSTMDMAGKALPRDGIEQSRNLHTSASYNPNVVNPSLEARPSKTRHKYYPFIEVEQYMEEQDVCNYNATLIDIGFSAISTMDGQFLFSLDFFRFLSELFPMVKDNVQAWENKELKAIVFLMIVIAFALFQVNRNNGLHASGRYSNSGIINGPMGTHSTGQYSNGSNGSRNSSSQRDGGNEITATPIELNDGTIKVGAINFNPDLILGKGCEGTFVYKGSFDNRDVAVKRVLAACFSIADREVELLRESDEHPNVIRYFCMEQDRQFRYIALEYCSATLQDYVEGRYISPAGDNALPLDALSILRQATQGLLHLHTLDICHRDIKPHNVLISMPGKKGDVRAMISDFGLCKKLKVGRMSFSRRSGIAGTEGWIAPEMMLGNRSTTCSVDIFSLGCVYYYVLSKGHHPFGESFKRQANILAGDYNLSELESPNSETSTSLIQKMIEAEPNKRPPAAAVLKHPIFWGKERILNFLQDVSDRLDLDDKDSAINVCIEKNRFEVVRDNWYNLLDPEIAEDLRSRRTYNETKVSGLLRALRNKKHHYQELHREIKTIYGRFPDQFADYWLSKFPKLLIHSWLSMHCVKNEPTFLKHYHKDYEFIETYFRGEVNIDQKTPEGEKYKRYEYPTLFGSRVNRGDDVLMKSKYPTMLGLVGDESDQGSLCYSRQSSIVSQWDMRSGDEDAVSGSKGFSNTESLLDSNEDDRFNFHDMSKAIPENLKKQTNSSAFPKTVGKSHQADKVFHFTTDNEPGELPYKNGLVNDEKRNEKGSPKVRKNVVQLDGNNSRLNKNEQNGLETKCTSWAVAAGGVQNIDSSPIDEMDDQNANDQNFYPMPSSDSSELNDDPNLCDKLHETFADNQNVFENFRVEKDENFKKCSNNGWSESNDIVVNENGHNESVNKSNNKEENELQVKQNEQVNNDDFSCDPSIKETNNTNKCTEEIKHEENHEFSPDKSAEFFLRSLINDTEEPHDNSVGPIWILPPDDGQKKKSNKKKKKKVSQI